jgi:hypothetical protein
MAIKPKKKMQNPLATPGGGAKGGSMGTGGAARISVRPGNGTKPAPKPKVELKPEPSSVTVKGGKYNIFGPDEAIKANKALSAARSRTNPATAKVEKRALKSANKNLKSKPGSSRANAQAESNARVSKYYADRKKAFENMKPGDKAPKKSTAEQKFALRRSMDYGPDGVRTKQSIKDTKFMKAQYKEPMSDSTIKKILAAAGLTGAGSVAGLANELRKYNNKKKKK